MKKIIYCFLLITILILPNNINAQTRQFEEIKISDLYIYGYGESEDYDVANKHALEDLLSKISVNVERKFEYYYQQEGKNFKEYSQAVMNTYSNATLTGIEQLKYEKRGIYHILRYIKKTDVEKIFENRTEKIKDYVIMGTKAQREYRIGDALRYYYWAYALWLSHPYRDEIKENVDGREILLGLLLQDRLNAIFSNIKFDVIDEVKNTDENFTKLLLHCSFNKHDVINIDYRYSIGGNVSALQEVENGFTEILLFDDEQNEIDKLRIGIEYKYINKSYHDKELSAVLNTVRIPFFKKSRKPVKIKSKQLNKAKYPAQTESPKYEKLNNLENSKSFY
jgi:hypothetical protein